MKTSGGIGMRATQLLHTLGQSLWPDNLTAELLERGTLKQYIDGYSITGLTSNPTIFNRAIKQGASYDSRIIEKFQEGKSGEELFFELALADLKRAAAVFARIHDQTNGEIGRASCRERGY